MEGNVNLKRGNDEFGKNGGIRKMDWKEIWQLVEVRGEGYADLRLCACCSGGGGEGADLQRSVYGTPMHHMSTPLPPKTVLRLERDAWSMVR